MPSRAQRNPIRTLVMAFSLAVVIACAAGAPAMADHHNYKGWFAALDLASAQPTGLDQQYATFVDPATGFATRQMLENDADLTFDFRIGYSWGALGGLSVSYWGFDNEDVLNESVPGSYVYPTVFGAYGFNFLGVYGLGYGFVTPYFPVTLSTSGRVQASTIDFDYFRPMQAGEKLTIKWIAGLRSATFEEDRHFDGADTLPYYIIQDKHIESDAFGIKVGADIIFGLTEHFSLQGGLAYSFLQGSSDAVATQNANGIRFDSIASSDDHVRGEIRDYDLRAVWSWSHFDFWVGYGGQTWDGLVTDPINGFCCDAGSGSASSDRDSLAFNKAHAGVSFKFGGSE